MMSKINGINCYRCFGDPVTGGNSNAGLLPPVTAALWTGNRQKWLRCKGFLGACYRCYRCYLGLAVGLLLLIQGGSVIALTADAATIRRKTSAVLTYRRPALPGAVLISAVQS
jgi:hypothetical protein